MKEQKGCNADECKRFAGELLPCPFCGGEDIRADANLAGDYLQCWACGARGPLSTSECSNWQARAAQPAPVVPEGVTIERDMMGAMHIKLGEFDFIQIQYQYPYTDNASTRQLAERIAAMLAAAPAQPAAQDQGEVKRLREALEYIAAIYPHGNPYSVEAALVNAVETAEQALAASTGQEVEK